MARQAYHGSRSPDDSAKVPLDAQSWQRLRTRLRQELRRRVRTDPETLEDLAQEACVRLVRALRNDPSLDPDACVKVIAQRTGADHLRGLYRQRRLLEAAQSGDVELTLPEAAEPWKGELLERLEFMLAELFDRATDAECQQLCAAWFEGQSWREVAQVQGEEHAAIRKRWSRCLKRAQEWIKSDDAWAALLRWSERT